MIANHSKKLNMDISVIVPVVERYDNIRKLYSEFSPAFDKLDKSYEFIFVVYGQFCEALEDLKKLKTENSSIIIIKLINNAESVAFSVGLKKAQGNYIFTLSSYFQVESEAVKTIWSELNNGYDLVLTRRYPRIDSKINRLQSFLFHMLIRKMTSTSFHDISCGLRGMKRRVLDEISLYGDLHRFIPILADKCGFRIKEVKVKQREEDVALRLVGLGSYPRRLLDILTVFFITKFTMKPLRFFGLIGMTLFAIGGIVSGYLVLYRLLGYGGVADRPLLLLGVVLMVLGVQTLSIGLIGELIIFTHASDLKEYYIEESLIDD
ncbi:MAG: glycosyltransferase [Candidatus Brocadiaceae bacterium]|nr:glycosyltransferase [Candidatus Brocadiaceae bacterium]